MQDEKHPSLFDLWDGTSYCIDREQLLWMKVESTTVYLNIACIQPYKNTQNSDVWIFWKKATMLFYWLFCIYFIQSSKANMLLYPPFSSNFLICKIGFIDSVHTLVWMKLENYVSQEANGCYIVGTNMLVFFQLYLVCLCGLTDVVSPNDMFNNYR